MKNTTNIQLASHDTCTGCAACVSVCSKGCITMREDRGGFLQPHIDADTCIECHKCEKTCPILKPIEIPTDCETIAYASINKDDKVRAQSSSGGMFYALAKWTIEQGGVVFGARYNEWMEVVHDYTETIEGINPFMRSKYVQSRIGDTFKQAKQFLKQNRWVLYVGTPCQIGGLLAFVGKKCDKLLTVDFICHGVPGPGVWKRYLAESFNGDEILTFNFRDKSEGWTPNQCIVTTTTSSTTIRTLLMENAYFRGFRNDIYLRNSCYDCRFREYHRSSDFTIADYWGVQENCPEMFDNKGTSIVFVHSKKAEGIFNSIKPTLRVEKQEKDLAIAGNRGMDSMNPVKQPVKRNIFYALLKRYTFPSTVRVMDTVVMADRYLNKIPRKIRKLVKR